MWQAHSFLQEGNEVSEDCSLISCVILGKLLNLVEALERDWSRITLNKQWGYHSLFSPKALITDIYA